MLTTIPLQCRRKRPEAVPTTLRVYYTHRYQPRLHKHHRSGREAPLVQTAIQEIRYDG
jgi:hypothetical protein